MIRSPKNLFLSILAFTAVCFVLAGMVGQHQDGWVSGMPQWIGDTAWAGFMLGLLATVLTGVWLLVQSLRGRGGATTS